MSVIGIDFGNDTCYVAVARTGGIETIDNDYSLRATPSVVAFGERSRILGTAAKNQMVANLKNTLFGFKRFIGRNFADPIVEREMARYPFTVCSNETGRVGFRVEYLNESRFFTPEQAAAMLFTKLKQTSETALGQKVSDCVISCPAYFTDSERCSLLDAAQMAGLNVLRLMNDTASTALNYGMYKQDIIPAVEEPSRNVVFVDCGHSSFQVFACAFNKGKLKMLATCSDHELGGRDFDEALANYFCEEFRGKYNIEVKSHPKAYIRLLGEVEKLKKQMSANSTKLPINIECFVNEKDVSSSMQRNDFEALCGPLFARAETTMKKCLDDSGLSPESIVAVEIVGGSTRIPAIKLLIEKIFGKTPSTTLNQDEAVARGCALQCAMLSPNFKVKDINITDVHHYGVNVVYAEKDSSEGVMEVFPRYHPVPFSRKLTFYRKEPFTIRAQYINEVPFPTQIIGIFKFLNIKPSPEGDAIKVQIKARINIHGCFVIEGATWIQKSEVEVEQPMETESNEVPADENASKPENVEETKSEESVPAETESSADKDAEKEKKTVKVKKTVGKSVDLPYERKIFGLCREDLGVFVEDEAKMVADDQFEKERIDAKNTLEEYIYEMRSKLEEELSDYAEETFKHDFTQKLSELENWLYDEGENQQKKIYCQHLEELKKIGEPIKDLRREDLERPRAIQELERVIQKGHKVIWSRQNGEATYDHLEPKEIDELTKAIQEAEKMLESARLALRDHKKHLAPKVKVADIQNLIKQTESRFSPIIYKKKPVVEPPKPTPANEAEVNTSSQTNNGGKQAESPESMDVE
ncbi:unnamed protein product [Allacma fusca]|uniref:Heat shock 70 kDa protein 4L n=1 Tax=Allacma fusca TaxID=39272 RepID=A0A8J2JPK7_9HEXA|nr:unnamed protein product [Allacma fusca]